MVGSFNQVKQKQSIYVFCNQKNFLFVFQVYFMCMLPACLYVQTRVCIACRPEWEIGSPETGIMSGCQPLYQCWEVNPGPLQVIPFNHSHLSSQSLHLKKHICKGLERCSEVESVCSYRGPEFSSHRSHRVAHKHNCPCTTHIQNNF